MTLTTIDHALNLVLTGLIYGSEIWIVFAFGRFVAQRRKNTLPNLPVVAYHPAQATLKRRVATARAKRQVSYQPASRSGEISITISPQADSTPPAKQVLLSKPKLSATFAAPPEIAQPIVCEPVDWKLWKAADLRKASVAKACGVRTRPIGSRKNLLKADLIAQYKQQLKRFTQVPPAPSQPESRIA